MNITTTFDNQIDGDMEDKVKALQSELARLPQYQPETRHYFHGGMYCREVFRKAGVLVVGAVHKKEHLYLIVSGTVSITTDDGVQTITGPHLFMSKPGTKRAVFAHTDTTCMTFHVIDEKPIDEVEAELIELDDSGMYLPGNIVKRDALEVTS